MSIPLQIEEQMLAELDGSLDLLLLHFRFSRDSAHCALRRAPSVDEAKAVFAQDGRTFHPPTAVAARVEPDGSVREPGRATRNAPIRSDEELPGIGDDAFVWRGYRNNQRGVVKFRSGRFIGEVNAPSVELAEQLAARLIGLTR
jgi:hypothetical protein